MSKSFRSLAAVSAFLSADSFAQNIYCSSLSYVGTHPLYDSFCQSACNQYSATLPGYCPSGFCKCANDEQPDTDFCVSPRSSCKEYVANPGTTASDQWCQANCQNAALGQECPCTMCICKDDGGHGSCPNGKDIRKEWHDLTEGEKQSYVEAARALYNDGTLHQMCTMHANISGQGHGDPYFFPFHRCFLKAWEEELKRVGWTGGMPYWDATLYHQDLHNDPIWQHFGNFDGNCINTGVFSGIQDTNGACIRRTGRSPATVYPPSWKETTKNGNTEWDDYRRANEYTQHGRVHVAIGGQMGRVSTSACDPVFYLHHAAIDYYWHDWQTTYDPTHTQYAPGRSTSDLAPSFEPKTVAECLSNIGLCVDYQNPQTSPFVPAPAPVPDTSRMFRPDAPGRRPPAQDESSSLPPRLTRQEAADLGMPFDEVQGAEKSVEEALEAAS